MEDRLNPRDWGKGIPEYKESDLMTPEEIHDFGVEIVASSLDKDGYKIHNYNPRLGSYPSIIAEKDNKVIAVVVMADVAPNIPQMRLTDKFGILGFCDGYDTIPCFAPVSIGSTDGERFDKSLALIGDGYYARYEGLQYISKELPKVGTEEYEAFVMQFIGGYLRAGNYDAVKEYIDDKCQIKNEINDDEVKEKALNYFINLFSKQPIISHCIIKSVGKYKTIKAEVKIEGHDEFEQPNTVKILQTPNKIGLLVVTKDSVFDNGDTGLVLNPTFSDKGKIINIEIIDPRLYGFEAYKD